MACELKMRVETWPIAGRFTIARGSRTEARVVVAELSDGVHTGLGECVPYARYGETVDSVAAAIAQAAEYVRNGAQRIDLQTLMVPGAARNAVDCAFWDYEAKIAGKRAWDGAAISAPQPVVTAFTLSLGSVDEMAAAAREAAHRPLLKVKLGTDDDAARIAAVRAAAPDSRLIVDANEGWSAHNLAAHIRACEDAGVLLIEQPLPASSDGALAGLETDLIICADESVHDRTGLADLTDRYSAINIKLDKTGGLTEALALRAEAQKLGLGIMVGCMVGTSLAMAPALMLTSGADYVDLDGPLLLARDREHGLVYEGSIVHPPEPELWG